MRSHIASRIRLALAAVLAATSALIALGSVTAPVEARPALAQVTTPTMTYSPDRLLEPGELITITLNDLPRNTGFLIAQCPAESEAGCGPRTFVFSDDAGAAETAMRVRRRIVGDQQLTNCTRVACELRVLELGPNSDLGIAPAPIAVNPNAPEVFPTVTISPVEEYADRQLVEVRGSDFTPGEEYLVVQCAGYTCSDNVRPAYTDEQGELYPVGFVVRRRVGSVDCTTPGSLCSIIVSAPTHVDHFTGVPAPFDVLRDPFPAPSATATPSVDLLDNQSVSIEISDTQTATFVEIRQCLTDGSGCLWASSAQQPLPTDDAIEINVSRQAGATDCAEIECAIFVEVSPFETIEIPISFDTSVPPPPPPSLTVTPNTDLIDLQFVDVMVTSVALGSFVQLAVCLSEEGPGRSCETLFEGEVEDVDPVRLALPRLVGVDGTDCATSDCELNAFVDGPNGSFVLTQALDFDPDAPLAPPPEIRALPNAGLFDGQTIEIRGVNFRSFGSKLVRQCAGPFPDPLDPSTCSAAVFVNATVLQSGSLSLRTRVQRSFEAGDGTVIDCMQVQCSVAINDGRDLVTASIDFDPTGVVDAFPAQLECVAWPAESWPTGPLPDGVTEAELDDVVAAARDNPRGGQSMVVIHGGRLVYEYYDDDTDASTALSSFSIAKSVAGTLAGMLIGDGVLDLDGPAPVPEWSDPDDPRHEISMRNLLNMAPGLEWVENYSFLDDTDITRMFASGDIGNYVADKPLVAEPGTQFNYSTGTSSLISRIMAQETGLYGADFEAFMFERLFTPLGIENVDLEFDPTGVWHGGSQANMSTGDFARLGLLYLRGGTWNDEPLLPEGWAEFARTPSPASNGYGAQLWVEGSERFSMIGIFGQRVLIAPDLDLIVAVNNSGGSTFRVAQLFEQAQRPDCGDDVLVADDRASVAPGGSVVIDVTTNDPGSGEPIAPTTLTIADAPSRGTAVVVGSQIEYTSTAFSEGSDAFTYVVCNASRACDEAAVSITLANQPSTVGGGGSVVERAARCSIVTC